jgi:PAS domain-containing protein
MSAAAGHRDERDRWRRYKSMFDDTWNLTLVLAMSLVVSSWYFGIAQVDVGPAIWVLAGLAAVLFTVNSQFPASSRRSVQSLAAGTQMIGTVAFGIAWHFVGGVQQPIFPLFVVLPLLSGSLVFGFWQQGAATLTFLLVLASGILLAPDTNAFIDEHYGISLIPASAAAAWSSRAHGLFADASPSPTYDLLMMAALALFAVAASTTSRTLAGVCTREAERVKALEYERTRQQDLIKDLVTHAPSAEVLVLSSTGRIVNASDRLMREFDLHDVSGSFLLDEIEFAYPEVIRRLITLGGDEIQGARVGGRDTVLRIRCEILGSGIAQLAAMTIERWDELCWRGEVDALEEPVFAINGRGEVAFLNRAALEMFGEGSEGIAAIALFDTREKRWWDIAPLDTARRTLEREGRRYIASIHRKRIADSIGELSFVHLHEVGAVHAALAS